MKTIILALVPAGWLKRVIHTATEPAHISRLCWEQATRVPGLRGNLNLIARTSSCMSQTPEDIKKPKTTAVAKPKTLGKSVFPSAVKHKEPPLLRAQKYADNINIDNYWLSEILDGLSN
jgi:hypothetical protein